MLPFFIIAGPCVIESEKTTLDIAEKLKQLSYRHEMPIVFKASFDKANRTSKYSFRGLGATEGLRVLRKVRDETGLWTITDVHETCQVEPVAEAVDVLQIPAYLCRQTDLIERVAATNKIVNIKKGQFMAPEDVKYVVEKGGRYCWITERGTCFGYNRLVVDFTGIPVLKSFGRTVIFDATHSVQMPSIGNRHPIDRRKLAIVLARSAIVSGVDGLYFEVHSDPDNALCDGMNSLSLDTFEKELPKLKELLHFIRFDSREKNND